MNRTVKKQFWLSREEEDKLKENARKTCLTEAGFLRFLIMGFSPKEKPDAQFHKDMSQLAAIGNNLNQIAARANSTGIINTAEIRREIDALSTFRIALIKKYLEPDEIPWR